MEFLENSFSPSTTSKRKRIVIIGAGNSTEKIIREIIRKKMNFKGILISDDISMKALRYDLITNARKSLLAGCNLVLYCAGNYTECSKLIKAVPFLDKFTQKKTSEFYKFLS